MTVVSLIDVSGRQRRVILGRELHRGGAGGIHLVDADPSIVVKLYHAEALRSEGKIYAEKITCMLRSVPSVASSTAGIVQIAWPISMARDSAGNFVGFAMPVLDSKSTENLESLLQPKQAAVKQLRSDLGARVTVAANLAGIVSAIHDKGYQIVDLKPPNLQFYRKELSVAVLDCDGFHIRILGRSLSAPQVTVDYLAPEFQGRAIDNPEHQDRFALAVIIFRLLNFGIHPYSSIAKDPNAPSDMEGKIAQGMYAYAIKGHAMIRPLPVSAHEYLPDDLRRLFDRTFGTLFDRRPTAHEWVNGLVKYAQPRSGLIQECPQGHLWFSGRPCGVCHRDGVLGGAGATVAKIGHPAISNANTQPRAAVRTQARPKVGGKKTIAVVSPAQTVTTPSNSSSLLYGVLGVIGGVVALSYLSHLLGYGALFLISICAGIVALKKFKLVFTDAIVWSALIFLISIASKLGWESAFDDNVVPAPTIGRQVSVNAGPAKVPPPPKNNTTFDRQTQLPNTSDRVDIAPLQPDLTAQLLEYAEIAMREAQYPKVVFFARRVIALDPDNVRARQLLGEAQIEELAASRASDAP